MMIPDRKPDYEISIGGKCVPKARPRFSKGRLHMPKKYVEYKNWASACCRNIVKVPTKKKVALRFVFQFEDWRCGDIDNLAGSIMDAMNKVVYEDDRQVVHIEASKCVEKYVDDADLKSYAFPAATKVSVWIL